MVSVSGHRDSTIVLRSVPDGHLLVVVDRVSVVLSTLPVGTGPRREVSDGF